MEDQNKPLLPFTKRMLLTLQAEEVAVTAGAIYLLSQHNLGLSFWLWIPLFFLPDISMLGYLGGSRTGAFAYNLFHHRAISLILTAIGFLNHQEIVIAAGLLLFAHSSFDRMLGFGLKYENGFNYTHLGYAGKSKS